MSAQVPHLISMLRTSGAAKAQSCEMIDYLEQQVGEDGMTDIMQCGHDFPASYVKAKAFCSNDDQDGHEDDSSGEICDAVNSMVRLFVCTCVRKYDLRGENLPDTNCIHHIALLCH